MLLELLPDFSRLVSIGLVLLVPVFLIYRKAGFHPLWSLLVFVPLGLLVIFIHLAYVPWANVKDKQEPI